MGERSAAFSAVDGKVTLSPFALLLLGLGAPFIGSAVHDRLATGETSAANIAMVQSLKERVVALEAGKADRNELMIFEKDVRNDLEQLKADIRELLAQKRSR